MEKVKIWGLPSTVVKSTTYEYIKAKTMHTYIAYIHFIRVCMNFKPTNEYTNSCIHKYINGMTNTQNANQYIKA